ncbi:putative glycoside hydrolase [Malonomonas rubra]|uniref:putative glycoside hydrolase n=1 Tax=Malonomonas rubra TaxID=57040 RepID=UPI0026F2D807|nr:putative glycoside hydrolase [Malonomonas rubra]
MRTGQWVVTLILIILFFWSATVHARQVFGSVSDAETGRLLSGVEFYTADDRSLSDRGGRFVLSTSAERLIARLPGYRPQQVEIYPSMQIALQPFTPKALYLSFWAADLPRKRQQILDLLEAADFNALVIDIKSSRGHIAYPSAIPLAREVGAQRVRPLKDLEAFLNELKARGIYTIGRMVVFKDDLLAKNRPELAVHTKDGQVWQDREQLSWCDPFNQQVQDYNLAVAEEAAQLGFDEVQFDYIRFPSKSDLVFSEVANDQSRVAAINSFLSQAKQRLASYPVFTSANIFGYICWKHRDGKIGQRLVDLGERVDYLSPMLYPSGFPRGIPGYSNPVQNPYEIIAISLLKAQQLSGLSEVRFRPWLQAFKDYAFDKRQFRAEEVMAQISASNEVGSNGWMLWNASSHFRLADLVEDPKPLEEKPMLAETAAKKGEMSQLSKLETEEQASPL